MSHHDPVYDIYWLTHGKSGFDCVSASTDGRLLWWDTRKLDEGPTDEFSLNYDVDGTGEKTLGATRIEYNSDAGPLKYLIGTEQGYVFLANKRPGRGVEIHSQGKFGLSSGKHHGPIYALQRNPAMSKYFLTVGDWTAKIWSEESKTPLMTTKYHNSYLTDGCWSPTRKGLFFLTKMDGCLDIWDYLFRQNEVAYSLKVSDNPLTSISIQNGEGKMAAIGDSEGSVTLINLCKSLYQEQPNEKELMLAVLEREQRREKNLEQAAKQGDKGGPKHSHQKSELENAQEEKEMQEDLMKLDEEFFKMVGIEDDEIVQNKPAPQISQAAKPKEEPKKEEPKKEEMKEVEKEKSEKSELNKSKESSKKSPSQKSEKAVSEEKATPKSEKSDKKSAKSDKKSSAKGSATPVSAKDEGTPKSEKSKASSKKGSQK